jgi:apolipoprotein N-acyltransferase
MITRENFSYFYVLIFGLLSSLSFFPFNLNFFLFFGIAFLYYNIKINSISLRKTIIYGFLFYSPFLFLCYRIYFSIDTPKTDEYSFVFLFLFIYFSSLFLLSMFLFFKLKRSSLNFLLFPASIFLFDLIRTTFLMPTVSFTFGSSLINTPLSSLASIVGEHGLTFLLCLFCTLVVESITHKEYKKYIKFLITFITIITLSFLLSSTQIISDKVSVTILQPNHSDSYKKDNPGYIIESLIEDIKKTESDFIITPEAALPVSLDQVGDQLDQLDYYLKSNNRNLILGSSTVVKHIKERYEYSSLVGVGNSTGIYHKEIPMPFIEAWPNNYLFNFLNLKPISFSIPFKDAQKNIISKFKNKNFIISSNICYEALIPASISNHSVNSNVIIISSNTSSLGDGYLQDHMLVSTRFRAIENSKFILLSNNYGISAIIDYQGKVLSQSRKNTSDNISGHFNFMKGKTPFNLFGEFPLIIFSCILFFYCFIKNRNLKNPLK